MVRQAAQTPIPTGISGGERFAQLCGIRASGTPSCAPMGPPRETRRRRARTSEPTALPLRSAEAGEGRGRRYLFFSNELIGLGHLRRTLSIAKRLAQPEAASTS